MNNQYKERARVQALNWAMGNVYHELVNDECTPDFSCCYPDLYIKDEQKRWEMYHKEWGRKN